MRSIYVLLFVLSTNQLVAALRCYTCDGLCSCLNPTNDECPTSTQCYTVKRMDDGKILKKGCANNCATVNMFNGMCSACVGTMCNSEQSLTPMSGGYDECRDERQGGYGQQIQPQSGVAGYGQSVNRDEGLGQGFGGPGQAQVAGAGQSGAQVAGMGQGIGNQGTAHVGGLGQGVQPGYGGLGQNSGIDRPLNSEYRPAPNVGMGQGLNNQGYGQGFNNGMGQGFNSDHMGQGFQSSTLRYGLNTLVGLAAAAMFGYNRM
ncbi:hypothetical protein M3Y95_00363400 [Aphelenchoides besseyi]|nr:hypothetical protein M3Y95_00363400 [Aphelenchoides besseyi]